MTASPPPSVGSFPPVLCVGIPAALVCRSPYRFFLDLASAPPLQCGPKMKGHGRVPRSASDGPANKVVFYPHTPQPWCQKNDRALPNVTSPLPSIVAAIMILRRLGLHPQYLQVRSGERKCSNAEP